MGRLLYEPELWQPEGGIDLSPGVKVAANIPGMLPPLVATFRFRFRIHQIAFVNG
jgi:hypothetical protein